MLPQFVSLQLAFFSVFSDFFVGCVSIVKSVVTLCSTKRD